MICSVGKDLICFLHIKASQLTCFTSSTKKPNLTTTNKLIMLLKLSAEVIGILYHLFTTTASLILVLSQDQPSYWHHFVEVQSSPHVLLTCCKARPDAAVTCRGDTTGAS